MQIANIHKIQFSLFRLFVHYYAHIIILIIRWFFLLPFVFIPTTEHSLSILLLLWAYCIKVHCMVQRFTFIIPCYGMHYQHFFVDIFYSIFVHPLMPHATQFKTGYSFLLHSHHFDELRIASFSEKSKKTHAILIPFFNKHWLNS